ncbi:MAG: hypothetical protein K6B40_05330 [Firmicutes bacterium]|nr:hypothetical protein [Bacillota bacterium]
MSVRLPYRFQDGQKAYAAHLMANFEALAGVLNSVDVEGLPSGDMESALNALKHWIEQIDDQTVVANQAGNAGQILFSDGESFQDKLDQNVLKGQDGQCFFDRMYYFRVDAANGHLYVGVADDAGPPPLSIDSRGHLIYTID